MYDLAAQATPPVIALDRTGYLTGAAVNISGSGFIAGDVVTIDITATDASNPPESLTAVAGDDGAITASWTLRRDAGGNHFVASAAGAASGATSSVSFRRIAMIDTDKYDYMLGETVQIAGAGFLPGEVVMIQVQHSNETEDGADHLPFPAAADASGDVSAQWVVLEGAGNIFRITATGADSGLVATTTITDPPITLVDVGGADDAAGPQDVNFHQFENHGNLGGTPALALTWALDDTAFPAATSTCALIDMDSDGLTDRMACASVDGNPPSVSALSVFVCDDSAFTCGSPVPLAAVAGSVSVSTPLADPFAAAHACTGASCVTRDTVVNVTLRNADLGLPAGPRPSALVTNACTAGDCTLPMGTGFLEIDKHVPPLGTLTSFTFAFGSGQAALNGQSTFTITPPTFNGFGTIDYIPMAPGTYGVYENIPSSWQLFALRCGSQIKPGLPINGPALAGLDNVVVEPGRLIRCKFENAPAPSLAAVSLIKLTNGTDNHAPTGPVVPVGSTVMWTYTVTNTGNVTLTNLNVTDDAGTAGNPADDFVVGTIASLSAGASTTLNVSGVAVAGQHANLATVVGSFQDTTVTDSDLDHYFGAAPSLDLVKLVNGEDANSAPGPIVPVGSTVTFTFRVTNTGNVPLAEIVVSDNVLGGVCTIAALAPGESSACTSLALATAGPHSNIGVATGKTHFGGSVSDSDPGNYFAAAASLALVKLTNGVNNDAAPGNEVPVGSTVTWTYQVTNTGNVALSNVVVRDDNGTPESNADDFTACTIAVLPSGMTETCSASGTAIAGQYKNWGTATGTFNGGVVVATNPDHYFGKVVEPCVAGTLVLSNGSMSNTSGTPGNIRTYSLSTVSVKASAFSRSKYSGEWQKAYLGAYGSYGLGVTDGSEGDGSNDRHKVDNIGDRRNYVLLEFSKEVIVNKAYLAYVGADSDITIWIGKKTNPYTNHLSLSDAVLDSLGPPQDSLASDGGDRWASFNAAQVAGNVIVIAAKPDDDSPEDAFKLAKLSLVCEQAPNRPPDAKDDSASTPKNTPKTITVVTNDTDPDGDKLTVVAITQPRYGSVSNIGSGKVTYTPPSWWTGTTTFTYTISDGRGGTDTATVTVTVTSHYSGDSCFGDHDGDGWYDRDDDDDWWDRDYDHDDDHYHSSDGLCSYWTHYRTWYW